MKIKITLFFLLALQMSYAQQVEITTADTLKTKKIDEVQIRTFIKKDSEFSNKMPLRAIENPQVFSTIDKIFLQNQQVYTLDDGYRNIPGLQKLWNSTHRAGDGGTYLSLRGFMINNPLRNGLIAPVTSNIDAINLEKLEVLKGPSATLFGSNAGSYGGVINRVTKQPIDSLATQISIIGGNNNYYRGQIDFNSPITKNNSLLFRLNAAYTNEGLFQKPDVKNSYFAIAPSLTFQANEKLKLAVDYEGYANKAQPEQLFFYLNPQLGANNMKELYNLLGVDYRQSYTGDGLYTTANIHNVFGHITYDISDRIKSNTHINNSISSSKGYNPYFSLAPKGMFSGNQADTEIGIARADQSTENSKLNIFQVQQNFNLDYQWGSVHNRTVLGFDYMRTDNDLHFIFTIFDWQPLKNGDYSSMNASAITNVYETLKNKPGYDFDKMNRWNQIGIKNTYSAYVSNVISPIANLNILTAVRYESNQADKSTLGTNEVQGYTQSAWSPKFGATYEFIKDKLAVFGNFQNSFKSNGYYVSDNLGNTKLSDPETANQFEGGIKSILFSDRLSATINYYHIQVKNTLLNTGALVPNTSIAIQDQTGKLRSTGVELEINAYLVKGFSVLGGLSYNDSKYLKAAANVEGRRPNIAAAPFQANFYASYLFSSGQLNGLGFGIGGNYASDNKIMNEWNSATSSENIFILPKYFILNANAYYETRHYRFGIKLDNLTNQKSWIGYTTANPQKLMNGLATVTYKF